jgi:hypothetical protein
MGVIIKNTKNIAQIQRVIFDNKNNNNYTGFLGGERIIRVLGLSGTKYKIKVERRTSLTDTNTDATGYYNWKTSQFAAVDSENNAELGEIIKGKCEHYLMLPDTSSDVRYDVVIDPVGVDTVATLDSSVPTKVGDLSITQYGTRTATITPTTANASNYDAIPDSVTITRPKPFGGSSYKKPPSRPYFIEGGTGGVSSTRLILNTQAAGISPNMIVTGAGVAHGTTVKDVKTNVVTLSAACTIANNTLLRFDLNNGKLVPFSFTMVKAGGVTAIENTDDNADLGSAIGGFSDNVSVQTNGTFADGRGSPKNLTLDSTSGVLVGMVIGEISKDGVVYHEKNSMTVAAVVSSTVITLSENVVITVDNVPFTLYSKPDINGNSQTNPNIKVVDISSDDSTANVVISGYLDVDSVDTTLTHPLYLDDIITVS